MVPSNTPQQANIAIYWDLENLVLSRYDEVYGRDAWKNSHYSRRRVASGALAKLSEAWVNLDAVMQYAASQGTIAINRAYGDWSAWYLAAYEKDLQRSAIDLVQLFPLSGTKNGADIRLAVDVIEDLHLHKHVTDVFIVAGDSDYVAVAQRCRRMGRRIVGVGIREHSAQMWRVTCDEFKYLDTLLAKTADDTSADLVETPASAASAHQLLVKAMRQLEARAASGWVRRVVIKPLMLRLDSTFDESDHGFKTFTEFLDASRFLHFRDGESDREYQLLPDLEPRSFMLTTPAVSPPTETRPSRELPISERDPPPGAPVAEQPNLLPESYETTLKKQRVRLSPDRSAFWNIFDLLPDVLAAAPAVDSPSSGVHVLEEILSAGPAGQQAKFLAQALFKLVRILEQDAGTLRFITGATADSLMEEATLRMVDRLRPTHGLDLSADQAVRELLGSAATAARRDVLARCLSTSTGNTYRAILGPLLRPAALFWGCMLALSEVASGTVIKSAEHLGELIAPGLAIYGFEIDPETCDWLRDLLQQAGTLDAQDKISGLRSNQVWVSGDVWPLAQPIFRLYADIVQSAGRPFNAETFALLMTSDYYDSEQLSEIIRMTTNIFPDRP